jgi:hypothetical protein
MTIPEKLSSVSTVTGVLKAFVTVQPTSFRSLVQPDIELDTSRGAPGNHGNDALEQLLNALDIPNRGPTPPKRSIGAWTTFDITIHTLRGSSSLESVQAGQ